jgi:hypothetical protein
VFGTTVVDGRPGLIMERVDGADLLSIVGRKPWLVWSIANRCGHMQAELNSVRAPEGLPTLSDVMRRRITQSGRVPAELIGPTLHVLDSLPDGDRICHGDLHPGNIIRSGSDHVIIDWTNVARGDPAADYARTDLMLRVGDVPDSAPIIVRYGAVFARRLMLSSFRRSYAAAGVIDPESASRWEVPVVATRLCDGIERERDMLIRMLETRLHLSL